MFEQVLSSLGFADDYNAQENDATRRRTFRHENIAAEVIIGHRSYPVQNWSLGGVFFDTPAADPFSPGYFGSAPTMTAGADITLKLRFTLFGEERDIEVEGRILRSDYRGTAVVFSPLSASLRRKFDNVLDRVHAERFLESQMFASF